MSAEKKKPSVLEQVLHPSTPPIAPRSVPDHDPQTGEFAPMNRPRITPLAGFEKSSIPHPSSPAADPSSPFSLDPRERFGVGEPIQADPPPLPVPQSAASFDPSPHPAARAVTFSITPTLGAVSHSGDILDRIREHVHGLGLQAKVTFHF